MSSAIGGRSNGEQREISETQANSNDLDETAVLKAITGRRSVRGFLDRGVEDSVIDAILTAASRAPSGQNMQPWGVHVVTGSVRAELCREVCSAAIRDDRSDEYTYLPETIVEPYRSRRRKVGFDLYGLYGIAREDIEGRTQAYLRNFQFFGAPVGLFFVMDRVMGLGSWVDCGAFMQNVMILARAAGLETCPQQAWCDFGAVVHRVLSIPTDRVIVSGMALGYLDADAPANELRTERVRVEEFVVRHR